MTEEVNHSPIAGQNRQLRRKGGTVGTRTSGFETVFDIAVGLAGLYLLLSSTFDLLQAHPEQWDAGLLLLINGVLAGGGFIVAQRRGRPIFLFIFLFDFIFFSIGPLEQLAIHEDPIYSDDQLTLLAISLCCMFSALGLPFVLGQESTVPPTSPVDSFMNNSIFDGSFQPLVLFVVITALSSLLLMFYWPALLISRETIDSLITGTFSKTFAIIFLSFLNPLAFVGAAIGLAVAIQRRSHGWILAFSLCGLLAVLANNPINFARFRVSALIIFAVLLLFGVRRIRTLSCLLVAGLLTSGFLNEFRYNVTYVSSTGSGGYFSSMDFHVLNLICYTIKYVSEAGYSFGNNIIGAMLFFIPRTVWEGKSEHIAYYFFYLISRYRYYGTDNLASPVVAEGYFAFGVPGAILLSIAVLYTLRWVERRGLSARPGSAWYLLLCISPMLTFILMRGPFIVGYAEFFLHFATILISIALLRVPNIWTQTRGPRLQRLRRQ